MLLNTTTPTPTPTPTSQADSTHRATHSRSRAMLAMLPILLNMIGCGTTCGPISIRYEFETMHVDGIDTTDITSEYAERQLWTGIADYQKDVDAVSLFTARIGLDGEPTDWSSVALLEAAE